MTDRIGPTAHYTGHVWSRNGLSHPGLSTVEGRILFDSLQPTMLASRAIGGPTLEAYLLARHRAIDARLEQAIRDGVTQVIEVAAGLSPRGWRFVNRHEHIVYVEADLPGMAERKRNALEQIGSLGERHRVREVDALRDGGEPGSLAAVISEFDQGAGLAIVTEGLLGYLTPDAVAGMWRRFAQALERFPIGRYISDVHMGGAQTPQVRVFRVALSAFVRGRVYLHFEDAAEAEAALGDAGFTHAEVRRAADLVDGPGDAGRRLAHILEASTR